MKQKTNLILSTICGGAITGAVVGELFSPMGGYIGVLVGLVVAGLVLMKHLRRKR